MLPLVVGAAFARFVPGPQCGHPAENRIFDSLAASPDGRPQGEHASSPDRTPLEPSSNARMQRCQR